MKLEHYPCVGATAPVKTPSLLSQLKPCTFTFGGTSAIVTSMGLIVGMGAATVRTTAIVSSLLIVAVADNISDSLSIHMYQEAESLDEGTAFKATLINFLARLLIAFSFVIIVLAIPKSYAGIVALAWGFLLLASLSYILARARHVGVGSEIVKHLGIAVLVIATSRLIGSWILHYLQGSGG